MYKMEKAPTICNIYENILKWSEELRVKRQDGQVDALRNEGATGCSDVTVDEVHWLEILLSFYSQINCDITETSKLHNSQV